MLATNLFQMGIFQRCALQLYLSFLGRLSGRLSSGMQRHKHHTNRACCTCGVILLRVIYDVLVPVWQA